jgi:hypothetical protein
MPIPDITSAVVPVSLPYNQTFAHLKNQIKLYHYDMPFIVYKL